MRIEIHASEGGDDAVMFASELAEAVRRGVGAEPTVAGRVICLESPKRL